MHVRIKWCVQWRASLDAAGYGHIMREQIPTELLNYQPRARLTEPSDTSTAAYAAIVIENTKIDETNLKNAAIVLCSRSRTTSGARSQPNSSKLFTRRLLSFWPSCRRATR